MGTTRIRQKGKPPALSRIGEFGQNKVQAIGEPTAESQKEPTRGPALFVHTFKP